MELNLSILVVTYNCTSYIKEFIHGLVNSLEEYTEYEILIHDNGSQDGTFELLNELAVDTTFVTLIKGENIGFAKANNVLLRLHKYERILFLNPDVFGFSKIFWKNLFSFWDHKNPLFIRLLNKDGSYQESTNDFISFKRMFKAALGRLPQRELLKTPVPVEAGIMAFYLIDQQMLDKVGYLTEHLFMYGEDTDWCYRARQAGYENMYDPRMELIHTGGAAAKSRWRHNEIMLIKYESEGHFIKTYYSGFNKIFLLLVNDLKRFKCALQLRLAKS